MLVDPGHIQKAKDAIAKLDDAGEKLCAIRLDTSPTPPSIPDLVVACQLLAGAKLSISALIPPDPPPV